MTTDRRRLAHTSLMLLVAAALALAPATSWALADPPQPAGATVEPGESDDRSGSEAIDDMLERITSFLHRHEVGGITPDPRIAINPSEANRLSVVSQLLGFNQMDRLHPSRVTRDDVIARADFLVDHFYQFTSGSAFDGMTGYALLGAYERVPDPRYLEKARLVVERSIALSGWANTLN